MTRHLTDRAQRLGDANPVHPADGPTDPKAPATIAAVTGTETPDKAAPDTPTSAQSTPEPESPDMAHPSAMDYQAGFTSGR